MCPTFFFKPFRDKEELMLKGAGGTPGGVLHFVLGLSMMLGGLYLLASNIIVTSGIGWGFGYSLYHFGGFGINAGSLLISFMVGVGMLFFNGKSILGWIVSIGSLGAIVFGVIMSLRIGMKTMSLLDISIILLLIAGGFGFFLRSLFSSR